MQGAEAGRLFACVDHPALCCAEEPLDYTEAIACPSIWAGRLELERIAAEGIESETDRQQFLREPNAYLQEHVEGQPRWVCPLLAVALDRGWCRLVEARIHVSVRTAAIRTTFTDAQIAR